MYFCVNEFEVGVHDSIFFGNNQQKVYYATDERKPCIVQKILAKRLILDITGAVVTNAPTRTSTLKNESNANSTVPGMYL